MKKKLSLVCPTFNSGKFIANTIRSILQQSFKNFELIIIVDPSSDNTIEQIKKFKDPRIILIINKYHKGLVKSTNLGIKISNSDLIARIDSDDLYLVNKLKKQYNFLKKNPEIDMVGTNAIIWNKNSKIMLYQPLSESLIRWCMIFAVPFLHPTLMIRKKIFYNYSFYKSDVAEDYDLYLKLIGKVKCANIPDFMTIIRKHPNNSSILQNKRQKLKIFNLYRKYIYSHYKIRLNNKILNILLFHYDLNNNKKNIKNSILILKKLRKKFLSIF